MKKLFLLLIILNLFSANLNAATFNWFKHNILEDDSMEIYYDKKTVLEVGSYKYFWTLANFLKDVQNDMYSSISHNMANCDTNEVKIITFTIYDAPMARGNVLLNWVSPEEDPDEFVWEYYHPKDTIFGEMVDEICKIR